MRIGSLFDGIGGFPLAALKNGITPVWASEIEKFPIEVTKKHFPDMRHLGDITQINGAEIDPVDVITFGSPCQDLSVAGKREGLSGERSGLFSHAVRIIREMRAATDGKFPRFAVWENVPGAFSSNKGQDFRAVIEEIAETEIPMPRSGKWATAGMVRTERVDIAWRVLDAQYWGVPQRRKRIFLVADFGSRCAAEILFKPEGLSRHLAESGEAREGIAAAVGDGVKTAIWDIGDRRRVLESRGISPSLLSKMGTGGNNVPIVLSRINCTPEGITGAVSSKWAKGTGGPAGDEHYNLVAVPQLYDMTHADEVIRPVQEGIAPTLNSRMGTGGNQVPVMLEPIPIHDKATRYKGGGPTRKNDGAANGFGVGKPGDAMPTLGTGDRHAVAYGVDKKGDDEFAKSNERNAREILRKLREEIGTEAFAEWGSGILNSLQQAEILQPGLYGRTLGQNREAQKESQQTCKAKQGDSTEDEREGAENNAMREMWGIIQKIRCTPQGQGHIQQFTRELNDIMQELPQFNSPAKREVPDMWRSGQGTRLLQQTLSSLQEIRRPLLHQVQYAVRRLTPTEASRLQGFPDWWLDIEGASDTAKYKAIGNSIAVPCVDYIMSGIARVLKNEKN